MKTNFWIAAISAPVFATLALASAAANAGDYAYSGRSSAVYDYADVLSVTPVVRYVDVRAPVQQCWDDVEYYTERQSDPYRAGRTLFGAILGGVIGHQIGSGRGNDAATVAGTLIGAAVGSNGRNGPDNRSTEYSRPVRRCETSYRSHQEERIEGYDVIYRFNGRKYATRTPFDPGKKLKIRVDVRPAS